GSPSNPNVGKRGQRPIQGKGPIRRRPAPTPLTIPSRQLDDYLAMPACAALERCIPQAPHLPLSIASCAAAISFSAAHLLSPSAMASTEASVFVRLSLLQPAATLAACAGTTARVTAAIAAAPIIVLIMRLPHFSP